MIRAIGFIMALTFAALPRLGTALPTVTTGADANAGEAWADPHASPGPALETLSAHGVPAASDSASITDGVPFDLHAPALGGVTLGGNHSAAPLIVAGLAIGAAAAPAILSSGSGAHENRTANLGLGYRSAPPPALLPTPGDGAIDPPPLDIAPSMESSGPSAPSTAPAIPEPSAAALLAAGLLAFGAALTLRR